MGNLTSLELNTMPHYVGTLITEDWLPGRNGTVKFTDLKQSGSELLAFNLALCV